MRCHAHTYERRKTKSDTIIYKCLKCPHYIGELYVDGRLALCPYCGNEFLIKLQADKTQRLKKPHCGCTVKEKRDKAASIAEALLGDE